MRHLSTVIAVAACIVTAGCTTFLQSRKPAETGITQGAIYHLPELHYDVEVKRTLTRCPELPDQHHPQPAGKIEFQVSATATPRTVAGPEVVIDYESLSAFTKTTDFSLERYPSGILKSFNATVDDRTADVAQQAFKAIVSVGKIAIGLPNFSGVSEGGAPTYYFLACSAEARDTLGAIPDLRKSVRSQDAELKKATKALADFEAAHPESPREAGVEAQAAAYRRSKLQAQEALEAANEELAKSLSEITVISRFTYVPGQSSPGQNVLASQRKARFQACAGQPKSPPPVEPEVNGIYSSLADEVVGTTSPESIVQLRALHIDKNQNGRWLIHTLGPDLMLDCDDSIVSKARWSDANGKPKSEDVEDAIASARATWAAGYGNALKEIEETTKRLQVTGVLVTTHSLSPAHTSIIPGASEQCVATGDRQCGILYRTKMPGRLRICRFISEGEDIANPEQCHGLSSSDPAVLFTDERSIPQLGHLASLGLRNGPFTNNELSASFSEDGTLIKMGYKKPRAEAVALGETINAGIDSVTALKLYSNGKELRDLGDQKALNDAQVALLNSQKALVQPREITSLENQAGLVKAQSALIDAQIQLRKKQAELDALNESVVDDGS
ncbi:hypothetical protein [Pseudomonas gingeri]|uniref:hypothetical protein n=1 Tax=Pseudomonas gingeri TaxID=117681 RepID=UPI0015A178B5|nr:hypothetical protein [Pseudomonas gingeri]NVZ60655.1 hypothetical protein [Pseudomonas gingeri]NVZ76800.1 hypothetical protein [Pseudomonas gingeri]NWA11562.1 hypothetical protein [Pseudomonas gingeri]